MKRLSISLFVVGCGAAPAAVSVVQPTAPAEDIVMLERPPADVLDYEVRVTPWKCEVVDTQGVLDSDLHLPVGKPVRLVFVNPSSVELDVKIRRGDVHVARGVSPKLIVRADHAGTYSWQCPTQTEKPGASPERPLYVDEPDEFAKHHLALLDPTPTTHEQKIALGAELYLKKGCTLCHTVDGTQRVGPSWKGLWGTTVQLADGSDRVVDATYVEESILHPAAFARPGFPNVMPSFEGQLKPYELDSFVAYIESLAN